MIRFDDLHKSISNKVYVPVIGDVMATRWAYEGMMVEQFRSNRYQKPFFEAEMAISQSDWHASFLMPRLRTKIEECRVAGAREEYREHAETNFRQISYHFNELAQVTGIYPGEWMSRMDRMKFDDQTANAALRHADSLRLWFRKEWAGNLSQRDSLVNTVISAKGREALMALREKHHNEGIADMVLNRNFVDKVYETDDMILQKADPVYMAPGSTCGRSHFYAPYKRIGSLRISTLIFNAMAMWVLCGLLFVALYFNLLRKIIDLIESFHIPVFRKFTAHLMQ
jgi:ABC transport system ATP-binding/permease protein